jgi:hypothetical protein
MGCETAEVVLGETTRQALRFDVLPDIILLSTGAGKSHRIVSFVHESYPHARLLVATEARKAEVTKAYTAGAAVVAPPRAFVHAVKNICYTSSFVIDNPRQGAKHAIEREVVQDFHDSETGRLDAARIARAYGVTVAALAKAVGVTQSALSRRTTALRAQAGLRHLEVAWAALLSALESPERIRAWLNTQRQDIGGKHPIALLLEGSAEGLAGYVRSVIAGEPG